MTLSTAARAAWTREQSKHPERVAERLRTRGVRLEAEEITLLEQLLARRRLVPELISETRRAKVNPFPNWR